MLFYWVPFFPDVILSPQEVNKYTNWHTHSAFMPHSSPSGSATARVIDRITTSHHDGTGIIQLMKAPLCEKHMICFVGFVIYNGSISQCHGTHTVLHNNPLICWPLSLLCQAYRAFYFSADLEGQDACLSEDMKNGTVCICAVHAPCMLQLSAGHRYLPISFTLGDNEVVAVHTRIAHVEQPLPWMPM